MHRAIENKPQRLEAARCRVTRTGLLSLVNSVSSHYVLLSSVLAKIITSVSLGIIAISPGKHQLFSSFVLKRFAVNLNKTVLL